MFDQVKVIVKGGNGGDGAISFRREKFVPFGGPDGGDGGDGGDVILMADPSVSTLNLFAHKRFYRAENGKNGGGRKKSGRKGKDLILQVPTGTVAIELGEVNGKTLIADLEQPGQQLVIARGGRGGWGNARFATSTNQAPVIAQRGETGVEKAITLELRLIADVGLIGYPNVGKSTLLTAVSAAKPRIASYPFTTLEPILGVVDVGQRSFVWAEIPGLIDGAHLGRGLGHDFLRHIMRTKILIHLIDGTSVSPVEDMIGVNTELGLFDSNLVLKPQLVAVNKIDLPGVRAQMTDIKKAFREAGTSVHFISAATGEGISEFIEESARILDRMEARIKASERVPRVIFRPQPRRSGLSVRKEAEAFIVEAPEFERIVARVDVNSPEVRHQLWGQLGRLGARRALEKAGVKPGDKIRCGNFEWEW